MYITNVHNNKREIDKPQIDKYVIIMNEIGTKIFIKNREDGRDVCNFFFTDKEFGEELAEMCLRRIEEREMELGK